MTKYETAANELQTLKEINKSSDVKHAELNKTIQDLTYTKADLEKHILKIEKENRNIKKENESATLSLRDELQQLNVDKSNLDISLAESRISLEELIAKHDTMTNEIDALKEVNRSSYVQHAELNATIQDLTSTKTDLEKQIVNMEEENGNIKQQHEIFISALNKISVES